MRLLHRALIVAVLASLSVFTLTAQCGQLMLVGAGGCLSSSPGFALVTHTASGATGGNPITSSGVDTSTADLLFVVLTDYEAATLSTITDSKSNTWFTRTSYATTSGGRTTIFYAKNAVVGSAHTFTATSVDTSYSAIFVLAFSGSVLAAPYDVENGATASGATSISPGSITPSLDNSLIVQGLSFDTTNTIAIGSGMTITDQVQFSAGNHFGGAAAYKIQTSTAAINAAWSWSASGIAQASVAAFKAR